MGKDSGIEWTDHTWNPWRGCQKVSSGCKNCYMFRDQQRYGGDPTVIIRSRTTFNDPLKWKDPALIFTCSWSDWFIEDADNWRDEAWDVIRRTPWHTYQILTKRPENIVARLPADWNSGWPNVWLGVSVESERYYGRLDILRNIPAAVRFLSAEPLLGPLDLAPYLTWLDWIITGGESGTQEAIRPANLDWFRAIRDQCRATNTLYHHKQHGGWFKNEGAWGGRMLDERTWDERPEIEHTQVPGQIALL